MTTLIIVRHGQSQSNLEKRFTGQFETPLTELGHRQAEATSHLLATIPLDAIYSSDLSRALDTAAPTARRHGLQIQKSRALREINAGDWEGKLYSELMEQYPKTYSMWRTDLGHTHPEGGEHVLELAARVYDEIDRILAAHKGQRVAIFTHATPLRMLACRWFGIAPENAGEVPFCTNASVSEVEYYEDGRFCRIIRYGYDKHQGSNATALPKGIV